MRWIGLKFGTIFALAFGLAGCGGGNGGGGGGGGGTPANVPPVFTSPAAVQAPENATGTIYTATATDANGDAFEFAIYDGADAGLFQITRGGALSFRVPPDFERPGDANRDNVYEVRLVVGDSQSGTALALRITVTDVVSGAFQVRRVGTGFTSPVFLAALPDDSGRVLVVERAGRIRVLNPATGSIAATPFLDIVGQVSTDGERGLLGLALSPDYMTSGHAYVFMTALDGSIQIRRYTSLAGNRETLDAAGSDLILRVPHTRNIHIGGWIGFDAGGTLNVAIGDGGDPSSAQQVDLIPLNLFGKILRIDPTRDNHLTDPDRNYAGAGGVPFLMFPREIQHWGLRNPFRASFDRVTGEMWIGDVGEAAIEEINRVGIVPGVNFGWSTYEGTLQRRPTTNPSLTPPGAQYSHGTGPLEGNSITGGYVYRGPVESLYGHYIFADFVSNNVWSVPIALVRDNTASEPDITTSSSAFTNRNSAFSPDVGTLTQIASFGEDQVGNLFIVSLAGSVFMIQPAP